MPKVVDGGVQMVPYRIDEVHNEPWHIAKVGARRRHAWPGT